MFLELSRGRFVNTDLIAMIDEGRDGIVYVWFASEGGSREAKILHGEDARYLMAWLDEHRKR